MAQVYAVVNQKGGVAKTTTAINIAACAALDDYSVLVVDSDPQANATGGLGVDRNALEYCLYDLLTKPEGAVSPSVDEVIVPTATPNLAPTSSTCEKRRRTWAGVASVAIS